MPSSSTASTVSRSSRWSMSPFHHEETGSPSEENPSVIVSRKNAGMIP